MLLLQLSSASIRGSPAFEERTVSPLFVPPIKSRSSPIYTVDSVPSQRTRPMTIISVRKSICVSSVGRPNDVTEAVAVAMATFALSFKVNSSATYNDDRRCEAPCGVCLTNSKNPIVCVRARARVCVCV